MNEYDRMENTRIEHEKDATEEPNKANETRSKKNRGVVDTLINEQASSYHVNVQTFKIECLIKKKREETKEKE